MAAVVPPLDAAQQEELQGLQREFFEYQQFLQEKFWRYRTGEDDYNLSQDQIEAEFFHGRRFHKRSMLARQVPRQNYRGQFNDAKRRTLAPWAEFFRTVYGNRGDGNRGDGGGVNLHWVQQDIATDEFQRATAMMTAKKNFTFIKILGAGGNGMVVLWKWTPGGNPLAQGHNVVMKLTIEIDDNGAPRWGVINDERRVMTRLVRAPHIAQAFIFPYKLPAPTRKRRSVEQHNIARSLITAPGLLFMEYARLGDLRACLHRLADEDRHLPTEAMWRIFDCLVKACIAMDYPPRFVTAGPPLAHDGGFLPEVIPPGGQAAPVNGYRGLVHFDLDPKNIFVFGYDPRRRNPTMNPSHTQVPRIQIGDFGITEFSDSLWAGVNTPGSNALDQAHNRMSMWQQREMSKPDWYLPEQFSPQWDLLDRDPAEGPLNAAPGTWPPWTQWPINSGPGRYSHRSNIWHVGMNMFCLMLLQKPDFPPVAGRMTSEEPAGDYNTVPVPDQRWTFGYRLIQDTPEGRGYRESFTPALCETVARCLMARQEHRPDLARLQADIAGAIGAAPPRLPASVRRFFGSDAPPPAPWRSAYTDVDLQHMDPFDPYPGGDDSEDARVDPPAPGPRRRKRRRTRQAPEDMAYRP